MNTRTGSIGLLLALNGCGVIPTGLDSEDKVEWPIRLELASVEYAIEGGFLWKSEEGSEFWLSWGGLDCGEADAEPGFCGREWYWWRYRHFQGWTRGGNIELTHPAWERINEKTIRFTYSQNEEQIAAQIGEQPRIAGSSGRCTWVRKPLPSGELLRAGAVAYGYPIPDEVEFPVEMPIAFFLEGNPGYFESGEWCQ